MVACLVVAMFTSLSVVPAGAHSSVSPKVVEKAVRTKFASTPILIKIAHCESSFRQYKPNGAPLYNEQGSSAVGVMQIMSSVHNRTARKMGYDIKTLDGNLNYALHLYKSEGTRPWKASRRCWS